MTLQDFINTNSSTPQKIYLLCLEKELPENIVPDELTITDIVKTKEGIFVFVKTPRLYSNFERKVFQIDLCEILKKLTKK